MKCVSYMKAFPVGVDPSSCPGDTREALSHPPESCVTGAVLSCVML